MKEEVEEKKNEGDELEEKDGGEVGLGGGTSQGRPTCQLRLMIQVESGTR